MEEAQQLVSIVLHNKVAYKALLNLRGEKAQEMSEILQKVSDNRNIPLSLRHSALCAAVRLCTASGAYPQCLALQNIRYETNPVTSGAFGDIWRGYFKNHPVCLKVARVYKGSDVECLIRSYTREAIMWSYFSHPNLLPFYGIYKVSERFGCVGLVSPWMENGNVNEYLQANPTVPRLPLVRDIVTGLKYLHMQSVVHGDLKGANILISRTGSACLADFGLSSVVGVFRWTSLETTTRVGGTVRWQAPEIMEGTSDSQPTFSADVYSLASVLYEVFTGRVPFHEIPKETTVMLRVIQGLRPTRPSPNQSLELSTEIWEKMQECWSHTPGERPPVDRVAEGLCRIPPTELIMGQMGVRELERVQDAEGDTLELTPLSFRAAMRGQDSNFTKTQIELLRGCTGQLPVPGLHEFTTVLLHNKRNLPTSSLLILSGFILFGFIVSGVLSCLRVSTPVGLETIDSLEREGLDPDVHSDPINPSIANLDIGRLPGLGEPVPDCTGPGLHTTPRELDDPPPLAGPSLGNPNIELGVGPPGGNQGLPDDLDTSIVCCVCFSADGKYLATGCHLTAQIYDTKTGQKTFILVDEAAGKADDLYIRSVCLSLDGLATGALDKLIRICIRNVFDGHQQGIYSLDFSQAVASSFQDLVIKPFLKFVNC